MNYSEYRQLHKDFTTSYQETEALKSLLVIATERHDDWLRSIAHEFADNSGTSIIHSSGEQTIYDALKKHPVNIYRIPGVNKNLDHPLFKALMHLEKNTPDILSQKCMIAITVSVQKDFDRIEELKHDVEEARKLFQSKMLDVRFNVNIDIEQEGELFIGGMLIQFYPEENEPLKDIDFQAVIEKRDELTLNGVSSNDMANFIREIIAEFVRKRPGITLPELQRALSSIYDGYKFQFVEEKEKIKTLAGNGENLYYSLAYANKLDDGTEYVVYNQLLRYKHLRKAIQFAMRNSII